MPGYPQDTSAVGLASPLKGYQAAADPVVRAGTHGLVYYNGLVFDRGDNGKSGIFLARFIDRNNKENGDPIAYLGTSMVATSDGTVFLDKPWMAVDLPRGNAPFCASVGGTATGARGEARRSPAARQQRADRRRRLHLGRPGPAVRAGRRRLRGLHGDHRRGVDAARRDLLKRSMDCGATWSAPMRVSRSADAINQGATHLDRPGGRRRVRGLAAFRHARRPPRPMP